METQQITPEGTLTGFVSLVIPSTKFDHYGSYSCQMRFTGSSALTMMRTIDAFMAKAEDKYPEMKQAKPPYEIDGNTLVVKFKAKAARKYKNEIKANYIRFFDGGGNTYDMRNVILRQGSTIKIAYIPFLYGMDEYGSGVSLQIKAVQIINLIEDETILSHGGEF